MASGHTMRGLCAAGLGSSVRIANNQLLVSDAHHVTRASRPAVTIDLNGMSDNTTLETSLGGRLLAWNRSSLTAIDQVGTSGVCSTSISLPLLATHEIVDAKWHPLSENHFVVLTNSVILMIEIGLSGAIDASASGSREGYQLVELVPLPDGCGPASVCFSPNRAGGWDALSVAILCVDGAIIVVAPFIGPGTLFPSLDWAELHRDASAALSASDSVAASTADTAVRWLEDCWTLTPGQPEYLRYSPMQSHPRFGQASPDGLMPAVQGPMLVTPALMAGSASACCIISHAPVAVPLDVATSSERQRIAHIATCFSVLYSDGKCATLLSQSPIKPSWQRCSEPVMPQALPPAVVITALRVPLESSRAGSALPWLLQDASAPDAFAVISSNSVYSVLPTWREAVQRSIKAMGRAVDSGAISQWSAAPIVSEAIAASTSTTPFITQLWPAPEAGASSEQIAGACFLADAADFGALQLWMVPSYTQPSAGRLVTIAIDGGSRLQAVVVKDATHPSSARSLLHSIESDPFVHLDSTQPITSKVNAAQHIIDEQLQELRMVKVAKGADALAELGPAAAEVLRCVDALQALKRECAMRVKVISAAAADTKSKCGVLSTEMTPLLSRAQAVPERLERAMEIAASQSQRAARVSRLLGAHKTIEAAGLASASTSPSCQQLVRDAQELHEAVESTTGVSSDLAAAPSLNRLALVSSLWTDALPSTALESFAQSMSGTLMNLESRQTAKVAHLKQLLSDTLRAAARSQIDRQGLLPGLRALAGPSSSQGAVRDLTSYVEAIRSMVISLESGLSRAETDLKAVSHNLMDLDLSIASSRGPVALNPTFGSPRTGRDQYQQSHGVAPPLSPYTAAQAATMRSPGIGASAAARGSSRASLIHSPLGQQQYQYQAVPPVS